MKKLYFPILLFIISFKIFAQDYNNYRSPLDIPIVLSANFGELRPNHFHTGIDLKTQGVVNKNVYSIEDGFVSRIGINAGGYGLVLYIDHPNGQTSVYAHMNSFSSKIAKYVKDEQYKQERYSLNIENIPSDALPVKKGELIGKSGNTGSSGGPHVHFEIRETASELTVDPLPYYQDQIKDSTPPEVRAIAVYPIEGEGSVNNSSNPYRTSITRLKDGSYSSIKNAIEAWGKIGVGIYTIDRMDGTQNIYGVKTVKLFCDDIKVFSSDVSSIDFSTTRMINSLVDYDFWRYNKKFYMKSFIEPGNQLHIYEKDLNGYININEEKVYNFRYELEDIYGNNTSYRFSIQGKKQNIPEQGSCSLVMHWDKSNRYISDHFYLTIPKGYLYKNVNFLLNREDSDIYYSQIYKVHNSFEPLNDYVEMSLKLQTDTLTNKKQYGIVQINDRGKESWIGGEYNEHGFITTKIRELGQKYAITADTKSPSISPVTPVNWVKNKKIVIKLTDDLSGIQSFRGTIDGAFALFEHDVKSTNYTYRFDSERLTKGGEHLLEFVATDGAGNTTRYEYIFNY